MTRSLVSFAFLLLAISESAGCGPGTCSGTPYDCRSIQKVSTCNGAPGCSAGLASCALASGDDCDYHSSQGTCQLYDECIWRGSSSSVGTCSTRTGCGSNTTQAGCEASAGCEWQTQECTGTPQACESYADKSSCMTQIGCTWESS